MSNMIKQQPVTLQDIHSYVIVRNREDNKLFDIAAIGFPDDKGKHDILFYSDEYVEFEEAVETMESLNKKLGIYTEQED